MAGAFNRSGATRAVALDISKAFDRVWLAGLLYKLNSYGILGQIFGLISSFLSNRQYRVVLDVKSSQEYPVNTGVPQGFILVLLFSYYSLLIFLILLFMLFMLILYSGLWHQLELASKLESDLRDTLDWGRKRLVDYNAGKT